MKSRTIIPALLACVVGSLVLTACGTFTNPGAPDQSFDIDQDIQDLENVFKEKGVTIISYYSTEAEKATAAADKATKKKEEAILAAEATPGDEEAKTKVEKATKEAAEANAAAEKATKEAGKTTAKVGKKELRNQFISQRLTLINIQYIKFIRRFAVDKAQLDTAADMLVIDLDLAGTLVGGAATKAIFAAISGGTSASRTSINKNFFHEKTVPVLVTAMNAERKEALIPIFVGIGKSIDEYPFARALADLHLYYQAGTFIGALQSIQKDAGVKEGKAEDRLAEFRETAFTDDVFAKRIINWIWPNGIDGAVNTANVDALRAWIDRDESRIKDLPIQKFLDIKQLKEARQRATKDLRIPQLERE